jgi:CheY-like chemotaxis protein
MTKPVRQGQLRDALVTALTGESVPMPAPVALDAAALGGPAPGLRVLVAEDNPVNLKIALRLLAKLGCEAVAATDGEEAVAAVRAATEPFDVVLMDVQMPVKDGYDATRDIRRWEATRNAPRVPIVALTANAFEGDRARCYAAGMDLFLSKPYTQHQLATTLAGLQPRRAA